jgi:CheY-like chemotaxis protein
VSLPQLLLVDDSDAILAFEQAALSDRYALSTAKSAKEALQKVTQLMPAGVLLDLSMPEMDGVEMLIRLKAEPRLAQIPVIVMTSEASRRAECMNAGAAAFLVKPVRADDLLLTVGTVLEERRQQTLSGSLAILPVGVGPHDFAIPLENLRTVAHYVLTFAIPNGPPHLCQAFELEGRPVCVLDIAVALGVAHTEPLQNRTLVVLDQNGLAIALSVDRVRDPEQLDPSQVVPRAQLGGSEHGRLKECLVAMAKIEGGGFLAVLDPQALISPELLAALPALLRDAEPQTKAMVDGGHAASA